MQEERFEYLASKELYDSLTPQEREELQDLLSQFPKFAAQYRVLKQYWADKKSHSARDRVLFEQVLKRIDYPVPSQNKREPKKLLMQLAVAAIMLCVATFGIWMYLQRPVNNKLASTRTQRTITLEDGTVVTLNYKSVLYYPDVFSDDERQVTVEGEAFFHVAKDAKRPFIINTEHARLKVLGTSFNLRAYPDEETTEASLIEGMLEVTSTKKGSSPITLRPSEKIVINNSAKVIAEQKVEQASKKTKISFYKPTDKLAIETLWMENKLAFKDTRFAALAKVLERKYDVHMIFEDQQVANLRFSASFAQESLSEILEALQLAAPFSYHTDKDNVILTAPKKQ